MVGRIIRAGWGILILALAVLEGRSPGPREALRNGGALLLYDEVIDSPVDSPAGTSITVAGVVTFNGPYHGAAPFWGCGTAVFNGGSSPGDSPAVVPFEGSVRFGPAGTLTIELGSTAPGSFDRLEIQGGLEAGGTLVVVLLPGFAGNQGDSYEIVTAASVTGSFGYAAPNIGEGVTLALEQTGTSIRLTVAADCNGNSVPDTQEIAQNPAQDCDGNLVPDVCDITGAPGSDSNTNGFLDACEAIQLDLSPAGLSWTPLVIASAYDVIVGDMETLWITNGDFTAATQACLADDQSGTVLTHATDPPPGECTLFLIRGVSGGVNLSFDTFISSQAGSRDAEVAASVAACP